VSQFGQRALVIGSGIAGLTAAAAVAPFFNEIVVLERDELIEGAASRPGVPQGKFASNLLLGGQYALEELLPGFTARLEESGATKIRLGLDVLQELPGYSPFPRRDLGLQGFAMSRPHLEQVVRAMVTQLPNLEVRHASPARSLVIGAGAARVTGVCVQPTGATEYILLADLVIDATGRGAPTLKALEALGMQAPADERIGIQARFTTVVYRLNEARPDWKIFLSRPPVQGNLRSGVAFLLEHGETMLVSLLSRNGDTQATTLPEFEDFARTLPSSTLSDLICGAEVVQPPVRFAFPESIRRDFLGVDDFPTGLVPLGDAVCRINPAYGQGMTVAAQEARLLRMVLGTARDLDSVPRQFFCGLAPILDEPWAAAGTDFIYPRTQGTRPPGLSERLRKQTALLRLAADDPEMHRHMIEVQHLTRSPQAPQARPFRDRLEAYMQLQASQA